MKFASIIVGLLVLVVLPLVSAYQVNQPLTINVKLQYDNGTAISDVVVPACIASVYYEGNSSMVLYDSAMVAGVYHGIIFTPTATGVYTLSVKCSYSGETAKYYEDIFITNPIVDSTGGVSGSQTLNLNTKIMPEKRQYVVNLQGDTLLKFLTEYYSNGNLANSNQAEWSVVKDDKILNKGLYVIKSTGIYQFDYDFKDYVTGDYKIFLFFDGRTEIVDLKIIDMNQDLLPITGFVLDNKGNVSVVRSLLLVGVLLLILMVVVLFVRRMREGKRRK